eukprot:354624-Chlamydomonas_euryale.AAC.4
MPAPPRIHPAAVAHQLPWLDRQPDACAPPHVPLAAVAHQLPRLDRQPNARGHERSRVKAQPTRRHVDKRVGWRDLKVLRRDSVAVRQCGSVAVRQCGSQRNAHFSRTSTRRRKVRSSAHAASQSCRTDFTASGADHCHTSASMAAARTTGHESHSLTGKRN